MRKVVLFKSASEEYSRAFSEHDYEAIFVEPLRFQVVNAQQLSAQLLRRDYDGLVLTSPRAVEALAQCWDPTKFVIWSAKRVYTVGEACCKKIKLLLGLDALGMTAGNSENLVKIILGENPETANLLFPSGNMSLETLPTMLQDKGMNVDTLTVYETKENEHLRADLMELNSSEENPCCMVFFSPSGCEYIHRQLQTFNNRLYHLPHFAIGNTTAHKIENLGVEVAGVAIRPKADSLVESVEIFFSGKANV